MNKGSLETSIMESRLSLFCLGQMVWMIQDKISSGIYGFAGGGMEASEA